VIFFTIASANYLPRVLVLARSLRAHHAGVRLVVALADRIDGRFDPAAYPELDVREVERMDIPHLDEMMGRYDLVEFCTAIKPFVFSILLRETTDDCIVYLDPDIKVYAPLSIIAEELGDGTGLLTPHILTPIADDLHPKETMPLVFGIHNLGFLALRRCVEADRLLAWWSERLRDRAHCRPAQGMFMDQLWMTLAPTLFEGMGVWKHPGANVSWWNLHERRLGKDGARRTCNGEPLLFYHFSNIRPRGEAMISQHLRRFKFADRPDIAELYAEYHDDHDTAGAEAFARMACLLPIVRREPPKGVRAALRTAARRLLAR